MTDRKASATATAKTTATAKAKGTAKAKAHCLGTDLCPG
jgi:hypothetical protein